MELLRQLPAEIRPVFCPGAGFKDVFHLFQEAALVPLLWGSAHNHPTRPFLERICSAADAARLVKSDYGELLRRLFIGNRDSIKIDPTKQQTTYGKRSTTITKLATEAPTTYGVGPMRRYVFDLFRYLRRRNDSASTSSQLAPPSFPTAPVSHRYALSKRMV